MSTYIEVTGSGAATTAPDMARLSVTVRCDADDVAGALADSNGRSSRLVDAVRDHGVAELDIQTSGSGIQPRWDREGQRVVGYSAYQSVRIAARDLTAVGDLVQACAGAAGDALAIDSLTLEISDPGPLLKDARAAAFADAQGKAQEYAALAGRVLGKATVLTDVQQGMPVPRFAMAGRATADAMELAPGENSVTATVVVRWDWTTDEQEN